ncbi:ABC transporter ATP-binding protein [Candidatus Saccharibacteria bacterium]|nr:ABC transporter ATP-binding protein [Candidatus Saccharibacteria bacterium]MCB9821342.1 ABC transporter ATP-binding protein [Candidatus Nomurabacteria bacterium]
MNHHLKNLIKDVLKDMWAEKLHTIGFYLSVPANVISSQAIPLMSAYIIDSAANGSLSGKWKFLAGLSVGLSALVFALYSISRRSDVILNKKFGLERRAKGVFQIHNLPYAALVDNGKGDLQLKGNRKASYINVFRIESESLINIIITTIITIGVIASKSITFAFIYLGVFIPASILLIWFARKRVEINKTSNQAFDDWGTELTDTIQNAELVQQQQSQTRELERLLEVGRKQWQVGFIRAFYAVRQQMIVQFSGFALEALFVIIGLWFFVRGDITIGTYVLFQSYVAMTTRNVNNISHFIRNFSEETSLATGLDEVEEKYQKVSEPKTSKKLPAGPVSISINNLDFQYPDSNTESLKSINLEIPASQKVGIVGKSGSGKTTLTKLLLRLYEPTNGHIYMSGVNIDKLGSANTRKVIAYVPQEPSLFRRSIKDNIIYGSSKLDQKELVRVTKQAYVDEFAKDLPKGLDTVVGDQGIKLSGGQRQRVAIARALAKNAPVLLFDEATSALDSQSEAHIQKALNTVMKGRTSIVIAHRLSTLKHMDRIVVMDDGRIVEDGTHAELLEEKGLYYELWQHQSGGFIE